MTDSPMTDGRAGVPAAGSAEARQLLGGSAHRHARHGPEPRPLGSEPRSCHRAAGQPVT